MVLAVGVGGLVVTGPPCGWWIWLSSSKHKRTLNKPNGDLNNPGVRKANAIVENALVLLAVAQCRRLAILIEQPGTSMMRAFKPFKAFVGDWFLNVKCMNASLCYVHACMASFDGVACYVL